ncbi:MAG TPA: glutaredoxin family protein [Gammaproteobacteria bacterium]|nr:glutaredoxin family protein [Gammaproteobacteria bacterium]
MNAAFPVLHLYTRKGCCLCEDMEHNIQELLADLHFALKVHDIDTRADWQQRYQTMVPVLTLEEAQQEREICHYFLDPVAVKQALTTT